MKANIFNNYLSNQQFYSYFQDLHNNYFSLASPFFSHSSIPCIPRPSPPILVFFVLEHKTYFNSQNYPVNFLNMANTKTASNTSKGDSSPAKGSNGMGKNTSPARSSPMKGRKSKKAIRQTKPLEPGWYLRSTLCQGCLRYAYPNHYK